MDVLDFLAASEWPLVAGLAVWFLRKPLVRMADRVNPTKLDAWGLKAEFAEALDKVETLIPPTARLTATTDDRQHGAPADPHGERPPPVWAPASPFAAPPPDEVATSPVRSILADWMQLSSTIRMLADMARKKVNKPPLRASVEEAAKELGLQPDELAALRQLEGIRNDVVHAAKAPVSSVDAARFRMSTNELLRRLADMAPAEDLVEFPFLMKERAAE